MANLDPTAALFNRSRPLFLTQSSSIFNRPICSYNSAELGSSVVAFFDEPDSNTVSAPSKSGFFLSVIWVG